MTVSRSKGRSKISQVRARSMEAKAQLKLVRSVPETSEGLEQSLLAFDPDDDLAAIIAMPTTIPSAVRNVITETVCARFEFIEDLEIWLYAPNVALGGASPFERLAESDGRSVLRALGVSEPSNVRSCVQQESSVDQARPLRLVR